MSAMYRVRYQSNNCGYSFIMYAADAKSTKKADVRAAYLNVRKRAHKRLKGQGVKAKITSITCIG